jgi:hypothetical protein
MNFRPEIGKLFSSKLAGMVFLLACTGFLVGYGIHAAKINSVTVDEYVHLPAAISILQTGDLRLDHAGSPPLRAIAAIPSMYQNPVTDYNNIFWTKKKPYQFSWLFMVVNMKRYHQLYFAPRIVMVGLAVLLAMLVSSAAGAMFGRGATAIAALLICFSPEILAHAPLMTVDVMAACFFLPLFISTYGSSIRPARLTSC